MHRLGFDYDSSYTDTDPYEPQPGGCCTFLPYFNRGTVELPITLPQDHTLFTILQHADADLWLRKAGHIRDRGGMVLVLTHPDYAHDQRLARRVPDAARHVRRRRHGLARVAAGGRGLVARDAPLRRSAVMATAGASTAPRQTPAGYVSQQPDP